MAALSLLRNLKKRQLLYRSWRIDWQTE